MATSTETDADEIGELMEIHANLQLRLDEHNKNHAIERAKEEEVRKKHEEAEAKAKQAAGEQKLRKMGYKLENDKAEPMFDPKAILDEFAQDMKEPWEDFEDEIATCDYRLGLRVLSTPYRLAADDDPNLVARLKAYKEYLNARDKDITVCRMAELDQEQIKT